MKLILKKIKIIFEIVFNKIILKRPDFSEKKLFLQAQLVEELKLKKKKINNFREIEFSAFSQFGEDGIISWLTRQIPNINKKFLEIGTQDYWESNTRYLLKSQNWTGYIIEGSREDVKKIKKQKIYWQNNLKAINKFINLENINLIINKNIKDPKLGLFSLDIDGNDYWILKQINITSDLIVCEYNPIFGDIFELTIPYEKNFQRNKEHYSNLFFGCSIQALITLMKKKGYLFLGTNTQGMNAFFVNKKKFKYLKNKIKNKKIFFPTLKEGRLKNTKLNHKSLYENLHLIKDKKVIDIRKNKLFKLSEIKDLYSKKWKKNFIQ